MQDKNHNHILSKKLDLFLIKFPIIFPIIYGLSLYSFPNYENFIIFISLLLLAEPHFGATWPFFLDKKNISEIKTKKTIYIYIPLLIVIFSFIGFFYFNSFFLLIFFAINMYHVTRQSYGICKLYKTNEKELIYQENLIYFINGVFFLIGILRFYIPIINFENIIQLNLIIVFSLTIIFIYYYFKFKNFHNLLILITGSVIFLPICFVDKPIHAILMGVTMHYTQYLALTFKIFKKRETNNPMSIINIKGILNSRFFLIILFYGFVMTMLSSYFTNIGDQAFRSLIVIPIIGQMLHFYLDSQLWKFSVKHNRDVTLKHLYS